MALIEKTNHVSEAISHLIEQFKSKNKIQLFVTSWVNEVQELEGVFFDLLEDRWIDTAIGEQLDGLGRIVGESRQGRSDDVYRKAIRGKVGINVGSGTPEQIITYTKLVTGDASVELYEYPPASLTVRALTVLTVDEASFISATLDKITGAGIAVDFIWGESLEGALKKFDIVDQGFDKGKFTGAI